MPFEMEGIFREYQNSKSHQIAGYNQRAHTPILDDVIGYVADVTQSDRLTNRYTVIVPQLNNTTLTQVPRVIPGAYSQANGVGHLPPPLRPGQPVIISFLNNRSSLPVISGTIFTNGQIDRWAGDNPNPPQLDEKDSTNLALFPTPMPPEALAVKGDAEVKVHPMIIRTASPTQPPNSATALEVPGTTYVHDSMGNVFSYFAGERIVVGKNETKKIQGSRQSLADMPNQQAYLAAIRKQAEVLEAMQNWRTALGGEYQLGRPRPASLRSRSTFESGGASGQGLSSLAGSQELSTAMSAIKDITSLLDLASQLGGKQLGFLQKTIIPIIKALAALWGGFDKFGIVSLNFQIDLPLNLQISVSIKYDVTTGNLNLNVQIGFGSGTPITGSQPLPLRSEGGIIAGGYPQVVNPSIRVVVTQEEYTTSSIYSDYPILSGYSPLVLTKRRPGDPPVSVGQTIPYQVVARELNQLNFATRPSDAIASLLVKYGVPEADLITASLVELVRYGSPYDFIKIGAVLDLPLNKFVTVALLTSVGAYPNGTFNSIDPDITQLVGTLAKPSLRECPPVPPETFPILQHAQSRNLETVTESISSYFQIQVPNVYDWVANLSSYVAWTQQTGHPFYPALATLYRGEIPDFLLLTVYLYTGVDLRRYPRAYNELVAYSRISFPEARVGIL
jgi:hypothetical protein